MGNSYGRQVLGQVGNSFQLSADGKPEMKTAGVTLDWSLFAAHEGDDLVLEDGIVIKAGEKYAQCGLCIAKVTKAEIQTVDLSGGDDPNGGTFDLTVPGYGTAAGLAWNVSAAAVQAALEALSLELVGRVTVGKAGFVYTISFSARLGNVGTVTVDDTDLESAGAITVTIATTTQGVASGGKFGPADLTANDGRQTLTRGSCFLINETVKESDLHSDHPPALEGGKVWKDLLLAGTNNQPALAAIEAAMPRLSYAQD